MRIALSFGSGGARGFAHFGIIEELEARGHQIVAVSGASMGALVGGVYAAGKLPEFRDWAYGLTQSSVFKLLDFVMLGPGIVNADRVVREVSEIIGNLQIEDLNVPYTAVATDLTTRREIWFQSGPLDMAIRASIAIPSVITPVNYEGRILADGGITNPVPLEPLASVVSDAVIAVGLSGKPTIVTAPPDPAGGEEPQGWMSKLFASWGDRRATAEHLDEDADHAPSFDSLPGSLKVMDVINMSLETMQGAIERYRMASNPPDVLISVPRDAASTYDFHRAAEIAEVGRAEAVAAFDAAGL